MQAARANGKASKTIFTKLQIQLYEHVNLTHFLTQTHSIQEWVEEAFLYNSDINSDNPPPGL
jgi:hypothetical protein